MKLAIVGTSTLRTDEETFVRDLCLELLKSYKEKVIVLSGGAKGVDSIAVEVAKKLGNKVIEFKPSAKNWDAYKERNIKIAQECDELYCITTSVKNEQCYHHKPKQNHQKTAGCYTANQAKAFKKPIKLYIVPSLLNRVTPILTGREMIYSDWRNN